MRRNNAYYIHGCKNNINIFNKKINYLKIFTNFVAITMTMDNLITLQEYAAKCGVSLVTIYKWIKQKKLFPINVGSVQMVPGDFDVIIKRRPGRPKASTIKETI